MTKVLELTVKATKIRFSLVFCVIAISTHLAGQGQTVPLRVLYFSDWHARISPVAAAWEDPENPPARGGLGGLAKAITRKKQDPMPHLVVMGGDWVSGSPEAALVGSRVSTEFLNPLQIDVAGFGDAECVLPSDQIESLSRSAKFKVLAANYRLRSDPRASPVASSLMLERGGIRIGVTALVPWKCPPEARVAAADWPPNVDAAGALKESMKELRDAGAELIVLISHHGSEDNAKLAELVPGIHLIIGGHLHGNVLPNGFQTKNGTWIVQGAAFGITLGVVDLTFDRRKTRVREFSHHLELVEAALPVEIASVQEALRPFEAQFRHLDDDLGAIPAAFPSGFSNDHLAQVIRQATGADLVFLTRDTQPRQTLTGRWTRRRLYDLWPAPEETVLVGELRGSAILDILQSAAASDVHPGFFVSGAEITRFENVPTIFVEDVLIQNQVIDPHRRYRVAATSTTRDESRGVMFWRTRQPPRETRRTPREFLMDFLQSTDPHRFPTHREGFKTLKPEDALSILSQRLDTTPERGLRKVASALNFLGEPGREVLRRAAEDHPRAELRQCARRILEGLSD